MAAIESKLAELQGRVHAAAQESGVHLDSKEQLTQHIADISQRLAMIEKHNASNSDIIEERMAELRQSTSTTSEAEQRLERQLNELKKQMASQLESVQRYHVETAKAEFVEKHVAALAERMASIEEKAMSGNDLDRKLGLLQKQLIDRIGFVEQSTTTAGNANRHLEKQCNDLQKQLGSVFEDATAISTATALKLEKRLEEQRRQMVTALEDGMSASASDHRKLERRIKELGVRINQVDQENTGVDSEQDLRLAELQRQLVETGAEHGALSSAAEQKLERQIAELNARMAEQAEHIAASAEKDQRLERKVAELISKLDNEIEAGADIGKRLDEVQKQLGGKIGSLEVSLTNADEVHNQHDKRLAELQRQLATGMSEVRSILDEKSSSGTASMLKLEKQMAEFQTDTSAALQEESTALRQNCQKLETAVTQVTDRVNRVQESATVAIDTVQVQNMKETEKVATNLQEQVAQIKTEIAQAVSTTEQTLQQKLEDLGQQLSSDICISKEEGYSHAQALRNELTELAAKLQQLKLKWERIHTDAAVEANETTRRLQEATADVQVFFPAKLVLMSCNCSCPLINATSGSALGENQYGGKINVAVDARTMVAGRTASRRGR